jgi:hypothetical protein
VTPAQYAEINAQFAAIHSFEVAMFVWLVVIVILVCVYGILNMLK